MARSASAARAAKRISPSPAARCSPPQAAPQGLPSRHCVFCNEVKGKSALALSLVLGLSYKSAFVLLHKLREAMAEEMKGRVVGGEGKRSEVDGGYFGGYVKPANLKENRVDRRYARNQNGKRKVVVIVRERGGNSVPAVFNTESPPAHSSRPASPRARS